MPRRPHGVVMFHGVRRGEMGVGNRKKHKKDEAGPVRTYSEGEKESRWTGLI